MVDVESNAVTTLVAFANDKGPKTNVLAGTSSVTNLISLDVTGGGLQILTSGGLGGFFGATPIAKPAVTGVRSDGTALTNLLSTLATLGLITNSTTA
jgi:hypothetical protein